MKTHAITLIAVMLLLQNYLLSQPTVCTNLVNEFYSEAQIKKPNAIDNLPFNYLKPGKKLSDVNYLDDSLNGKACNTGQSCDNTGAALMYQVYYPDIPYSDSVKLPAILLFHGGGFSDCSNFSQDGIATYCLEFAKRGFVAFNVEYRRGRAKDVEGKFTSASQVLAFYRAFQDGRGALRTIVAREISLATPYRIDVNNIFLGGVSSGADIALNVAYENGKMIKQVFPGISTNLGGINADNYFGNAAANTFTIKGVLSMWGGIAIPLEFASSPASFFAQNRKSPALIAFHGGVDNAVAIDSSDIFYSAAPSIYNRDSLCIKKGPSLLPDNGRRNADQKLLGSQALYNILKSLQKSAELYVDCDMSHGLDEATSDFGLPGGASVVTTSDLQKYIVQRAATFFQALMNKKFATKLTHTRFVNCANNRTGCDPDTANTCSNDAVCTSLKSLSANEQQNILTNKQKDILFTAKQVNKIVYINLFKPVASQVLLYSLNGNAVKTSQINSTHAAINCTSLASGIYVLRVIQGQKIQTAKIVLQ